MAIDGGRFEATVVDTLAIAKRGTFVEVEIERGTIARGASVSIETSAGDRVVDVVDVEFVDHRGALAPRGLVALGVSGLDAQAIPRIGGSLRSVHPCPCCRHLTLSERGGFEICPVCWWEDDGQDDHDADVVRGGPNGSLSLAGARASFATTGAVDPRAREHVRPARPDERPR
jgi:hypothetical protein